MVEFLVRYATVDLQELLVAKLENTNNWTTGMTPPDGRTSWEFPHLTVCL